MAGEIIAFFVGKITESSKFLGDVNFIILF